MITPLNKLDLDLYSEVLDNGLRIFVVPKNGNNIFVTFTTIYGSNQNSFIPYNGEDFITVPNGVAHFLEHKLFEQKDGIDPFSFFSKSGTSSNASTNNVKTTYLFNGPENFEENLNYLIDFVQEPYFTDENVEAEKGIIEQELKMYEDDPFRVGCEKSFFNTFVNDPNKISIGGTVESVNSITKEDLYTCYNTFYNPANMFIVVTGNVDPKKTIEIIKENQSKKSFEKNKKVILKQFDEPDNVAIENQVFNMNVTTPKIFMNFKLNVSKLNIERRFLLNYLSLYADLKFGDVSLFAEKLKNEKIIIDEIGYSLVNTKDYIDFMIMAESNVPDKFIEEIKKEIKINNTNEEDFNRKRKTVISSLIYMSDDVFRVNNKIVNDIILNDEVITNNYDEFKNLNYKEFNKIIDSLNFNQLAIVQILPKAK